jgi:hypothetical protein
MGVENQQLICAITRNGKFRSPAYLSLPEIHHRVETYHRSTKITEVAKKSEAGKIFLTDYQHRPKVAAIPTASQRICPAVVHRILLILALTSNAVKSFSSF